MLLSMYTTMAGASGKGWQLHLQDSASHLSWAASIVIVVRAAGSTQIWMDMQGSKQLYAARLSQYHAR